MNCVTIIQVSKLLGQTIHTREAAKFLLADVKNDLCEKVELDFSDVDYISRSFADQFHADKIQLALDQQKQIIVTNATEEVINMLQAVAKTQNKTYRANHAPPIYKYSKWSPLENFLLTI